MNVFNANRTFEFVVDKETYAGMQYFYKIILKEAGVNAIGFPYYCQIIIDPIEGAAVPDDGGEEEDGEAGEEQDTTTTDEGEGEET